MLWHIISTHILIRIIVNERDYWLKCLFMDNDTTDEPWSQQAHPSLIQNLAKWLLCAWSTSVAFTLILLIQCLPLFLLSTPTTPLYDYQFIWKMSLMLLHPAPLIMTTCPKSHLSVSCISKCESMHTQKRHFVFKTGFFILLVSITH